MCNVYKSIPCHRYYACHQTYYILFVPKKNLVSSFVRHSLWSFGKGLFFDLNHDTSYTDISRWMKIYISKKEIIKTSNNLKLKIKENKSFIFSLLTSSVSEYVHSTIFAHELPWTLKKNKDKNNCRCGPCCTGATGRPLVTDLKRELRTELGKEVLRKCGQRSDYRDTTDL